MEAGADTTNRSDARRRLLNDASGIAVARDMAEASVCLTALVFDHIDCTRVHCVFHDAATGSLWTEAPDAREATIADGLVGAAVRTERAVFARRCAAHPDWVAAVDDPGAHGDERIAVQPIAGAVGEVHAVIVVIREARRSAFGPRDADALAEIAGCVGPLLGHLARTLEANDVVARRGIFRAEALANHGGSARLGDVVRVTPRWVAPTCWIILACTAAMVALLATRSIHVYSTGIGVVRARDRVHVVARESGMIAGIDVEPGQSVEAGQTLARLDDAEIGIELAGVERRWVAGLRDRMRAPADPGAAESLAALDAEVETVRARRRTREIRAPHAGIVVDVRGALGQAVHPGDVVITMTAGESELELVALLPGADRPRLEPGMMLRFELPAYRHEFQWFAVTSVDDAVVGPQEAARQLGPEIGDVVTPTAPSVVLRAAMPATGFTARGRDYRFHDGMQGRAEIRLPPEPLLTTLLPGLGEVLP